MLLLHDNNRITIIEAILIGATTIVATTTQREAK
jgi:hypothetical protein